MSLTEQQIAACKQMEASGGPKSYAGAMLYHQCSAQKQRMESAQRIGDEGLAEEVLKTVSKIRLIEKEIKDKNRQLENEKEKLGRLIETRALLRKQG